MNQKISVVVPCYNSERYIRETIDSILSNQSKKISLEVIAVNDCSKDNTLNILMEYGTAIIIIDKIINEGACRARNDGIMSATGEFIALCDHDDIWEPDKLLFQLDKFSDPKIGLVCSDADSFNERGVITASMSRERPLKRGNVFRELLYTNFIVQSSAVVRRDVLKEVGFFDEQIFPAEDLDLWLRISQNWHIDYVDKVLVHYRISSTMYSLDKIRMKQARIPVIIKHTKQLKDDNEQRIVVANALYEFGMDYWYNRQFYDARIKFIDCIKYKPNNIKYYIHLLLTYLPVNIFNMLINMKNIKLK